MGVRFSAITRAGLFGIDQGYLVQGAWRVGPNWPLQVTIWRHIDHAGCNGPLPLFISARTTTSRPIWNPKPRPANRYSI
jgi:hypothetical protein